MHNNNVCLRNHWEFKCSLSVPKEDQIVGHIPFNLSPILLFHSLKRDVNKAFARVTRSKINGGAGYSLEIPCIYEFYGPKPYIDKLREVICLSEIIWTCMTTIMSLSLIICRRCMRNKWVVATLTRCGFRSVCYLEVKMCC